MIDDFTIKEWISKYVRSRYEEKFFLNDCEDKNNCFDIMFSNRNMNMTVEIKTRFFYTGINDSYLYKDDVLIELIQSTPYIKQTEINDMKTVKINIAIGWFYKCYADRLIYMRTLDDKYYDLIDIEYKNFKCWLLNNIEKYNLNYCDKTTGTINLVLPITDIPKPFVIWEKNIKKAM